MKETCQSWTCNSIKTVWEKINSELSNIICATETEHQQKITKDIINKKHIRINNFTFHFAGFYRLGVQRNSKLFMWIN